MRGALPCRRIGREPASPLLIHPGEVLRVAEDERGVTNLSGGPRGAKDGFAVAKDLPVLLLDRRTTMAPVADRRGPGRSEDEPPGDHALAVRRGAIRRRPGASGVLTITFPRNKVLLRRGAAGGLLRNGTEGGWLSADALPGDGPAVMRPCLRGQWERRTPLPRVPGSVSAMPQRDTNDHDDDECEPHRQREVRHGHQQSHPNNHSGPYSA